MKILNLRLKDDLKKEIGIKIDLGCGKNPYNGCYAVDHKEMEGVDVIADLNKPLHLFPDNCCEFIYSRMVFEHVNEFLPLMCEIHRILKPTGVIEIIVPHFSNVYGFSDPTHVRFFGLYSMNYFCSTDSQPKSRIVPSFYTDIRFEVKSIKIEFYKSGIIDHLLAPIFFRAVNINLFTQDFYERRLSSLFHAQGIRFLLRVEK